MLVPKRASNHIYCAFKLMQRFMCVNTFCNAFRSMPKNTLYRRFVSIGVIKQGCAGVPAFMRRMLAPACFHNLVEAIAEAGIIKAVAFLIGY